MLFQCCLNAVNAVNAVTLCMRAEIVLAYFGDFKETVFQKNLWGIFH
jgi:hypothetical protein